MADWTLYCDESGNAGANYWDQAQPFYAEGGWLVSPEQERGVRRLIEAAQRRRQEQLNKNRQKGKAPIRVRELKGVDLLKSREGQAVALDVVVGMHKLGCPAMFILAERRFCAAGKAVDVYLDDVTNPTAATIPLWGRVARLALWERIAALPDEYLEPFARAYKSPTTRSFASALTALVDGLCAQGDVDIAPVLESARAHLDTILEYEDLGSFGAGLGHPLWAALNIPVFFHVAKRADVAAEQRGGRLRIVHDPVNKFAEAYRGTVVNGTLAEGVSGTVRTPSGEILYMGVRPGTTLEFEDSEASFGVQAADVLVSSLARISRLHATGRPWTDGITRLAVNILPPLMEEHPFLVGAMASQDVLGSLLGRMVVEARQRGLEPRG